jgi:hypothetical protein
MRFFRLIFILLWAILLAPIGGMTDSLALTERCEPTTKVQVLVEQNSQDSSLYEYTIVNNSQSLIYAFTLGVGQDFKHDLSAERRFVPKKRFSPAGWMFGKDIYSLDSDDVYYVWVPVDKKNSELFVSEGDSLGGFKMKMPQPSEELKTLSFQVETFSGCLMGKVQPK